MDLLIPVLVKDENWKQHKDKLFEETHELLTVLGEVGSLTLASDSDVEDIVEEAMDVIQVCIGILDKVEKEHPAVLEKMTGTHIAKLINRGWLIKKVLRVHED